MGSHPDLGASPTAGTECVGGSTGAAAAPDGAAGDRVAALPDGGRGGATAAARDAAGDQDGSGMANVAADNDEEDEDEEEDAFLYDDDDGGLDVDAILAKEKLQVVMQPAATAAATATGAALSSAAIRAATTSASHPGGAFIGAARAHGGGDGCAEAGNDASRGGGGGGPGGGASCLPSASAAGGHQHAATTSQQHHHQQQPQQLPLQQQRQHHPHQAAAQDGAPGRAPPAAPSPPILEEQASAAWNCGDTRAAVRHAFAQAAASTCTSESMVTNTGGAGASGAAGAVGQAEAGAAGAAAAEVGSRTAQEAHAPDPAAGAGTPSAAAATTAASSGGEHYDTLDERQQRLHGSRRGRSKRTARKEKISVPVLHRSSSLTSLPPAATAPAALGAVTSADGGRAAGLRPPPLQSAAAHGSVSEGSNRRRPNGPATAASGAAGAASAVAPTAGRGEQRRGLDGDPDAAAAAMEADDEADDEVVGISGTAAAATRNRPEPLAIYAAAAGKPPKAPMTGAGAGDACDVSGPAGRAGANGTGGAAEKHGIAAAAAAGAGGHALPEAPALWEFLEAYMASSRPALGPLPRQLEEGRAGGGGPGGAADGAAGQGWKNEAGREGDAGAEEEEEEPLEDLVCRGAVAGDEERAAGAGGGGGLQGGGLWSNLHALPPLEEDWGDVTPAAQQRVKELHRILEHGMKVDGLYLVRWKTRSQLGQEAAAGKPGAAGAPAAGPDAAEDQEAEPQVPGDVAVLPTINGNAWLVKHVTGRLAQAVLSQQDPGLVKVAHVDDPCHPVYNNPFIRRRMRHKQRMLLYKRRLPANTFIAAYFGDIKTVKENDEYVLADETHERRLRDAYTHNFLFTEHYLEDAKKLLVVGDTRRCIMTCANEVKFWGYCKDLWRGDPGLDPQPQQLEGEGAAARPVGQAAGRNCTCKQYEDRKMNATSVQGFIRRTDADGKPSLHPVMLYVTSRAVKAEDEVLLYWDKKGEFFRAITEAASGYQFHLGVLRLAAYAERGWVREARLRRELEQEVQRLTAHIDFLDQAGRKAQRSAAGDGVKAEASSAAVGPVAGAAAAGAGMAATRLAASPSRSAGCGGNTAISAAAAAAAPLPGCVPELQEEVLRLRQELAACKAVQHSESGARLKLGGLQAELVALQMDNQRKQHQIEYLERQLVQARSDLNLLRVEVAGARGKLTTSQQQISGSPPPQAQEPQQPPSLLAQKQPRQGQAGPPEMQAQQAAGGADRAASVGGRGGGGRGGGRGRKPAASQPLLLKRTSSNGAAGGGRQTKTARAAATWTRRGTELPGGGGDGGSDGGGGIVGGSGVAAAAGTGAVGGGGGGREDGGATAGVLSPFRSGRAPREEPNGAGDHAADTAAVDAAGGGDFVYDNHDQYGGEYDGGYDDGYDGRYDAQGAAFVAGLAAEPEADIDEYGTYPRHNSYEEQEQYGNGHGHGEAGSGGGGGGVAAAAAGPGGEVTGEEVEGLGGGVAGQRKRARSSCASYIDLCSED